MTTPRPAPAKPEQLVVKTFRLLIAPKEVRLMEPRDLGPYKINWEDGDDLSARTLLALVAMLRDNRIKPKETQLLGEYLYKILLDNEIGAYLHEQVTRQTDLFLRVELSFEAGTRELIDLPWEYLYKKVEFGQSLRNRRRRD